MINQIFNVVSERPMILGECPLWDVDQGLLYWIDITACEVHRFDPESKFFTVWPLPSEPGCICLRRAGGLVVAMRSQIAILNTDNGDLYKIKDAPYDHKMFRFNDGRCDRNGRLWTGTLVDSRSNPDGSLYCLDRGKLRDFHRPVTVSNGIAFSPDSTTLYHSDTPSHKIFHCYFDAATGELGSSEIFKEFSSVRDEFYLGRPDGAAVDIEGGYWVAMYEGGCILRLSPTGTLLNKISVPMMCPTMIAFGGVDLKTLYITSSSQKREREEFSKFPFTGFVISTKVDVKGCSEFYYRD